MNHIITHHPQYLWYACLAIGCSALATIVCTVLGWRRGVYLLKPLTTLLIILGAMHVPTALPFYKPLIVAGLVFSLAGDVFLMLPKDRFVAGLVAFLAAHLLYIAAFVGGGWMGDAHVAGGPRFTAWVLAPFVVYAAVLLRMLLPHVPRALKAAVIVYAAALLVMAWQAAERGAAGVDGGMAAAIGGVLFVISDSALALNRFRRSFAAADAVVLATYFAAQTAIALSIR